jgi:hypothetical protein
MARLVIATMLVITATGWVGESPTANDLRDDNELLSRTDVQKELELIDEQLQGIKQSNERVLKLARDLVLEESRLSSEVIVARAQELQRQQHQDQLNARQDLLLPFQIRRLEELRWQYRAINDPVSALVSAVELSDDQSARLRLKEEELRQEVLARLRDFHDRAEREILELLTADQRAEWKTKCGREFKFETRTPGLQMFSRLR